MEFLNKGVFKKELKTLSILYRYETSKEQMQLYYEYLRSHFSDDDFKKVCEQIPTEERFFPSVSVFFKNRPKTLAQKAF